MGLLPFDYYHLALAGRPPPPLRPWRAVFQVLILIIQPTRNGGLHAPHRILYEWCRQSPVPPPGRPGVQLPGQTTNMSAGFPSGAGSLIEPSFAHTVRWGGGVRSLASRLQCWTPPFALVKSDPDVGGLGTEPTGPLHRGGGAAG